MEEKEKKPVYKKWWFWVIIAVVLIIAISSLGGDKQTTPTGAPEPTVPTSTNPQNEIQELKVGETWTVEGQWNLTINSVTTTTERNQFSEKTPSQVIIVTYSYENLGYEDKNGIMEGLYFSLDANNTTVIDGNGEVAYSYPGNVKTYAKETPVGAKCMNAQTCIGLNNKSENITMNVSKYDGSGKQQKVKFTLKVD